MGASLGANLMGGGEMGVGSQPRYPTGAPAKYGGG